MADATRTLQTLLTGKDQTGPAFNAARTGAKTFADGTIGHVRRVFGSVLNLQNLILGTGAALAAKSVFDPAIEMETFETQFTTLLGSVDAAKARLKDLADFAASTPFELPELAKASRVLQTLTKGALASGDQLRMVGDVAASVGAPVSELSIWFGRLYDGIQSGRPVGEAMARLQELGVVSGDVRSRIEALQAANTDGAQVWKVVTTAMAQYTGGMERLSQTTAGRLSTMRDNWKALRREVGEVALPALNDAIEETMAKLEQFRASGKAADIGRALAATITGLVRVVEFIGTNAETLASLGFSYMVVKIILAARAAIAAVKLEIIATGAAATTTAGEVATMNTTLGQAGTLGLLGKIGIAGGTAFVGWNLGKLLGDLLGVEDHLYSILQLLGQAPSKAEAEAAGRPDASLQDRRAARTDPLADAIQASFNADKPDLTPYTEAEFDKFAAEQGPSDAQMDAWAKASDASKAKGDASVRAELIAGDPIAKAKRDLLEADANEYLDALQTTEDAKAQARRDAMRAELSDLRQAARELETAAQQQARNATAAWDALLNPKTHAEEKAEKQAARAQQRLEQAVARARAKQQNMGRLQAMEEGGGLTKRERQLIAADDQRRAASLARAEADGVRSQVQTQQSIVAQLVPAIPIPAAAPAGPGSSAALLAVLQKIEAATATMAAGGLVF